MARNVSPSSWWLSLIFPLLFIVPALVAVHAFPPPGESLLGFEFSQEEFLAWEASAQTGETTTSGQDVIYSFRARLIGPSGDTNLRAIQSPVFLPFGVAITGDMSTHSNLEGNPTICPCLTPSLPLAFTDSMEFRFKTGGDLTLMTDAEITNISYAWDFSSFTAGSTLNVAIIAGSYVSTAILVPLRIASGHTTTGPVTYDFGASGQETVIAQTLAIPLTGSATYDFTAVDLLLMGAISTRAAASLSVLFWWSGATNRVGSPANTFDFDASIGHVQESVIVLDTTPGGQTNTVDTYGGFLVIFGILMLFLDFFALEVVSIKTVTDLFKKNGSSKSMGRSGRRGR